MFHEKVCALLGDTLVQACIFGSKVRGDFDEESDIDILIVMDSDDWRVRHEVSNIAADINVEYDCNISPVIYSRREHEKNRYFGTLFIQEIEKEGIPLE
ncbi:MAG: nucleotidyltransferase domain-containing protein [Deltaproteobacteria bacterium]|nr:nucleotidyltransferase domain-containing protein [Deltaproteobacteria bacterium]